MRKGSASSYFGDYRPISITPFLSKVFEKIVAENLSHFLESNSTLSPSQFLYCKGMETCDDFLTLSHSLQVALVRSMDEDLFNWTSQQHFIGLISTAV